MVSKFVMDYFIDYWDFRGEFVEFKGRIIRYCEI